MSNKEKLIASAQKSLLKGQFAKAIKDYQKVVELDPKDIRNRQKLADLFVRAKMLKEAQDQYEGVARYFSENGFFLKAIAVYKQIQRLDPKRVEIYHRLAELNARQGLVGNALAEYKSLVAHYEKQGLTPEAINVLHKMKDLDPENLNIRVKIAESYARTGLREKGLAEFRDILKVLRTKGDHAKALKLFTIFKPLFHDELEIRIGHARALIDAGQHAAGVEEVRNLLRDQPDQPALLRNLAAGLHRLGDVAGEYQAWSRLLKVMPADTGVREGYLRACLASAHYEEALQKLELWQEELFAEKRTDLLTDFYEQLHAALPDDSRVTQQLQAVYQACGEGDKLLDLMSLGEDAPFGDVSAELGESRETLDGSVLAEAHLDLADDSEDAPLGFGGDVEELPLGSIEDDAPVQVSAESDVPDPEQDALPDFEIDLADSLLTESAPVADAETDVEDDGFGEADLDELELIELPDFNLSDGEQNDSAPASETSTAAAQVGAQPTKATQGAQEESSAFFGDDLSDLDIEFEMGDEDVAPTASSQPVTSTNLSQVEQDRLAGDFHQFKKSLESQIDEGDAETHFNLGIAFKEMGLLDDAMAEFDQAMKNLSRRLDALILKGICLKEQGDLDGAEEAFKSALLLPDTVEGDLCNLYFELGLLHVDREQLQEALNFFEKVSQQTPSYREVGRHIADIRGRLGLKGGDDQGRVSYL